MSRPLEKTISGLKLRTESVEGALTFTYRRRKYTLPFEVRTIGNNENVFIHLPPNAGLFKLNNGELEMIEDSAQAEATAKTLRRSRGSSKKAADLELPKELMEALGSLPEGTKLVYGPDGTPRLAKKRRRRTSKA